MIAWYAFLARDGLRGLERERQEELWKTFRFIGLAIFQLPREACDEGLLGRNLRDDEEVSVMSLHSHPAPSGDERRLSAERLRGTLDRLAHKAGEVGGDEFDAAVDEAMNQIRLRRK